MRKKLSIVVAFLVVAAASAATLYMWKPELFERASAIELPAPESEFYCPMHPQQRSDKEGNCPICSMKLVKMDTAPSPAETAAMHAEHSGTPAAQAPATPSTEAPAIFIAPERQQLIGIKTVVAERKPLVREIRAVGKIAFDETKVTHIHTKVAGFIEDVFVDFVGKQVKRGDPLFTIYSPDLLATQEEYLLALKSNETFRDSSFNWVSRGSNNLLAAARKRLELWDITEGEIAELEKAGKAKRALTIYSPVEGIVTERAAYHHGRTVTPEMDLYTITDLSSVWILGQVYEYELPFIRLGQPVQVEFPYGAGTRERAGTIVFISPTLDPKTRTAQLRVEFPNQDMTLKPDMYVNFKSRVSFGSPLVVPADAVLDTGSQQYVFVDKGQGYFEPRTVTLGPEANGSYAIESGLRAGERVVTAANFILDSESRLKGVIGNMGTPSAPMAAAAAPAPNLQVEIVEPRTAKVGRNSVRLIAKDAQGNPIPDAEIDISVFMPQMGNMAPMRSSAQLRPTGQGQYAGEIDIPMAWTWETTVTAKKGGVPIGSAKTSITAR
jgi:Cu(I)/Ag(I) efflux system membrane fusion protein